MMKFVVGLIVLIIAFLVYVYLFQRTLIYIPDRSRPNLIGISDMQEVMLKTTDGLSLLSWYKPPMGSRPTILYLQGNAGNIGIRERLVRPYLEKGFGVLLLGYRGYGGNPGSPTEQGLYEDALAGWKFLIQQGVPKSCIVLFGESLGSGPGIELATRQHVGAIILTAPFTSLIDLGFYHYPYLPVKTLLKDRYESIVKIATIKAPLLILIAEKDVIVPTRFSKRLFEAANQPKELVVFKNLNHNDLPSSVADKVIQFLTQQAICRDADSAKE